MDYTFIESLGDLKSILESELSWFKIITEEGSEAVSFWSEKENSLKKIYRVHIYFRDDYLGAVNCIHRVSGGNDEWACTRYDKRNGAVKNGKFRKLSEAIEFILKD